jgi:protein TonB
MQREVLISLALHVLILVPVAIITGQNGRRIVESPVHTVHLVELPSQRPQPVEAAEPEIQSELEEPVPEPIIEKEESPQVEVKQPEPRPDPPRHSAGRDVRRKTKNEPSLREKIESRLPDVSPESAAEPEEVSVDEREIEEEQIDSDYSLEVQGFPYEWYVNVVRKRIDQNWVPPSESLISAQVAATVEFVIETDGKLTGLRLSTPSGRSALNASATEAVERSAPFPSLPPDYGSSLEVRVTFRIFPNR